MAEEYVQRSLANSKASGNIREEIAHYATLGNVYFHISEYAKAETAIDETAIEESKKKWSQRNRRSCLRSPWQGGVSVSRRLPLGQRIS